MIRVTGTFDLLNPKMPLEDYIIIRKIAAKLGLLAQIFLCDLQRLINWWLYIFCLFIKYNNRFFYYAYLGCLKKLFNLYL